MSFRKKIRTCASFTKILSNYISKESLRTTVYDTNIISDFSFKKVSGAVNMWNDQWFFYWIYRVSDAVARAKWLHSLIQKASIKNSVSCFFDILIGSLDIGIANWHVASMSKYQNFKYIYIYQISKFPGTLSFVIIPWMFWRNLTKIGQIYIPYKFAQSGCIPPKI